MKEQYLGGSLGLQNCLIIQRDQEFVFKNYKIWRFQRFFGLCRSYLQWPPLKVSNLNTVSKLCTMFLQGTLNYRFKIVVLMKIEVMLKGKCHKIFGCWFLLVLVLYMYSCIYMFASLVRFLKNCSLTAVVAFICLSIESQVYLPSIYK